MLIYYLTKSDVDSIHNDDHLTIFLFNCILQVKRPRTDNDTDALTAASYVFVTHLNSL